MGDARAASARAAHLVAPTFGAGGTAALDLLATLVTGHPDLMRRVGERSARARDLVVRCLVHDLEVVHVRLTRAGSRLADEAGALRELPRSAAPT
jgi:hypothetical protein